MDYEGFFAGKIAALKTEGRYRVFAELGRHAGDFPLATDHGAPDQRDVVVWCSNDYLGMGQNPLVLDAITSAVSKYGAGAGGTRNISGNSHPLVELEGELADLHGKPRALMFTSGYVANLAALGTLASMLPGCVVFSDAWNHSSMIEGIRHSRAEKRIFRHSDPAHLEELLRDCPRELPKLVAFESVYSMDGDIAPIAEFCDVAERYGAMTYLDEVSKDKTIETFQGYLRTEILLPLPPEHRRPLEILRFEPHLPLRRYQIHLRLNNTSKLN